MNRTELEAVKARVRESARRKGELESRMKAMKSRISGIAADCQIRVLASLVDAWKTATNWSTYADHIVGV